MSRIVKGNSEAIHSMRLEDAPAKAKPGQMPVAVFRSFHAENVISIAESNELVEQARQEARQKAMQEAEAKLKQPLQTALENLDGVLDDLSKFRRELFKEAEEEIIELLRLLGKKIFAQEISLSPEKLKTLVEKATEALEAERKISIFCNESDLQMFNSSGPGFLSKYKETNELNLQHHPQVKAGTAFVQTESREIEVGVELMVDELIQQMYASQSQPEESGSEGDKV